MRRTRARRLLAAALVLASPGPAGAVPCDAPAAYGRMFPTLPAGDWPLASLDALATRTVAEPERVPTPEGRVDPEEGALPAGYTYFGQLVDHDLTRDDRPNDLLSVVDVASLTNRRTPRLDLDSLYGSGPGGSPELYERDGVRLRLGERLHGSPDPGARDLPRDGAGQAVVGDPRDDENRIVAQLHSLMARAHNAIAADLRASHPELTPARRFAAARRSLVRHYQWAVVHDYLPRVAGGAAIDAALRDPGAWSPCASGLPVEFTGAAYRFGHSLVRPSYRINDTLPDRVAVFSASRDPAGNLGGFRPIPATFAVDWRRFFPMPGAAVRPQSAYRVDASLVAALGALPGPAIGSGPASLAERNLLRGRQLGLPTGQAVARELGLIPLTDDRILVGKATGAPDDAVPITAISSDFVGAAPLWTYVLAEAGSEGGRRLGPVGGRLVARTFVGVLRADRASILNASTVAPTARYANRGRFGVPQLVALATRPPGR